MEKTYYLFTLFFVLVIFGLLYITAHYIKRLVKPVDRWDLRVNVPPCFTEQDALMKRLGDKSILSNSAYDEIFKYFLLGIQSYVSSSHARIIYPGVSGTRGSTVEGLEGFARTSALLSSWISSGRPRTVLLANGQRFDILSHLIVGIKKGTSRSSCDYWGDITDFDQRIVEAADIAISIWLIKPQLDEILDSSQISEVLNWLDQINGKEIYGGNWILFRIVVNAVLTDFGYSDFRELIIKDYTEFKSFYVGCGWFSDGQGGAIDYYNVWQMQYMLFWFHKINSVYDEEFLRTVFSEFSENYQYFMGPLGIPIFGRSCCYRIAAAAPLIISAYFWPSQWSTRARRALDITWLYFMRNGSLRDGRITQGYHTDDEDLLENYSGRASPLWSLRSLTLAFYLESTHDFWTKESENLPIENQSYRRLLANLGMSVEGNHHTKEIIVRFFKDPNSINQRSKVGLKSNEIHFSRMSLLRKYAQLVLRRPLRIENFGAKYKRSKYSSKELFFNE